MRKVVCGILAFGAISAVAQVDKAEVTENRALCWFNYKSYAIDDQIYTIMYLLAAEKGKILHGTFSCRFDSMNEWNRAAIQVVQSVKVMDT